MILDRIEHLKKYSLPYTQKILDFIASHDCANLPDGEMEIEGRNLFVRIMSYTPKPASENKFETHQVYADLQYVVSGVELMQVAPSDQLHPLTEYDKAGDYQFFTARANISDLAVRAGECTVFFPGEAHRPSCLYLSQHVPVKKLVFKLRF